MGTHPIFESDFDCLTEWTFYVWWCWGWHWLTRRRQSLQHSIHLYHLTVNIQTTRPAPAVPPQPPQTLNKRTLQRHLQQLANRVVGVDLTRAVSSAESFWQSESRRQSTLDTSFIVPTIPTIDTFNLTRLCLPVPSIISLWFYAPVG